MKNNHWAVAYKNLTDDGRYEEGKKLLASVQPRSLAEERTLGHFSAQSHFYDGKIQEAFDLILETEKSFGSNIRMTGDAVVYLYHLDCGPKFQEYLQRFQKDFFAVEEKLSEESFFWSAFNLAKLSEEGGDIALSIRLFKKILDRKDLSSDRLLRVKASLLRCYSIVGKQPEIAVYYRDLFFAKLDKVSRFCRFELEHALLLAELYMIGFSGAEKRLQKILANHDFDSQEKCLSYYDFLDILMILDSKAEHKTSLSSQLQPEPHLFFEKEIGHIYLLRQKDNSLALPDFFYLKHNRSVVDVIRILSHCVRSQDSTTAEFCRTQLALLLETIPTASTQFWMMRLPQGQQVNVVFDASTKEIQIKARTLSLSRSPKLLLLLACLEEKPFWNVEDLCQEIYGFWDEHSSFDRLRMLVKSLNEKLRPFTGENFVILSEDSLKLSSHATLSSKN